MKKIIKFCISLILGTAHVVFQPSSYAKENSSELVYIPPVIHRTAYSLAYDARHRNPSWIYEFIVATAQHEGEDRSKFGFIKDPQIPEWLQASAGDFKGSGFDRGHLCPVRGHQDKIQETFYFTNISPQVPQFNRGYWKKLEGYVHKLSEKYRGLHVFTGPLYLPQKSADGKKYVTYQVIGENDVAVPTHFFKVILAEKGDSKLEELAYILPNEQIDSNIPLDQFKTTVKKVEKAAGMLFKPKG